MINLFNKIEKKINGLVWTMISSGVILLVLSIFIVWDETEFMLRLVMGLVVLAVAYAFIYGGYKLWALKKEIGKHLGIK